ncbi:MAG TPA: peptide chain release factor aRF-1 [Candidatus Bathyarchaeia archaeon]|nr:peptide chain release factor aRF-1 [Candidatus Bathyarchaeia archaeon]
MSGASSVAQFKFKRTLEQLAKKEGRGTELISLYVPPDRKIHEVLGQLREELGTAVNIKSRTTRQNVQDAIERTSQRLRLFKEPPPTGLVIFVGAIPQNGAGSEKMETYTLIPPEPITVGFYRCDARFHVEPLLALVADKDTYGILVIDGQEAVVATLKGRRVEIMKSFTSGIPGKSRAGGQSARRFERIREQVTNEFYKRVGQHFTEMMLNIPDLKGIIIGGPGPTKYVWSEGEYLQYTLKKKVLSIIDTSYTSDAGIEEVVEKSSEILKGVRYKEEKQYVQKFLYELGHETGKAAYGEKKVQEYLEKGIVDTLLISEKLEGDRLVLKCKTCGNLEEVRGNRYETHAVKTELATRPCTKCHNPTLEVAEQNDIIDSFLDYAEKAATNVEMISEETEEGRMLRDSFGKVAAVLRYGAN